MFHKTILSEVHRWVQSARRCQQVGLTKPLQGEYSQYHSVYKCVPALFLCFFCCESFSWSIMSTDSAAGSGRNEHVPVTSFFPSLLPPFAANFSRRFSSMACANHTILLASSIFNPLIDVSFWKCRCRFAFPMGQSLCCLFNDYIYIYVVQILRQKVSMLQARLRQGEVQGYFFVVGPIALPPDSPINMFWLGRCARLTQPTWLTRHPRTILYHIVSSLITHKISQDLTSFCMLLSLLAFVKFGVLECLGALTVLFAFVRTCPLQTWEVVDFVTQMTRWVSAQLSMTLVWTTWFSCWDPSEGSNQRAENILCIANCSLSVYIIYNWIQLSSRVGGLPVQNLALLITVSHTSMRIGQYLPWG